MPEFGKFIHKLINREIGAELTEKAYNAPERPAEEIYALWRDFGRLKMQIGKLERDRKRKKQETPVAEEAQLRERLAKVRSAIAKRWSIKNARESFRQNIAKSFQEKEYIASDYRGFKRLEKEKDEMIKRRDKLYQETFSHRGTEADELTQMEMAETVEKVKYLENKMMDGEGSSPELAASLSFERLQKYHSQLANGFIWTPSREKYFDEILEHLVILDQNRPVLLSGETGTGKTRLARAVGERLTGQPPFEVGEEAKTDIRPLLGSQSLDKNGAYVVYGQLGQALAGKENSRQDQASQGGLFYMDEMNGYPPDALRALIKQISGRRPGEEISFAAWRGKKEKITAEFGFLGSANLPSEKHPDRATLPVEVTRELSAIEVDYPPQTEDDPELYEMMLAALMDQNGRIRVPKKELAPKWNAVVAEGKTRQYELDTAPEAGGTLWRFANFVAEIQKSYKGRENVLTDEKSDASYLRQAVLDPGIVLSWLAEYRKSALRRYWELETFLERKIDNWRKQTTYSEEDRNLLKDFQKKFDLSHGYDPDIEPPNDVNEYVIMSPQEIGALSPRVPRQVETMLKPPEPEWTVEFTATGQTIEYKPISWQNFELGNLLTLKNNKAHAVTYKGLSKDDLVVLTDIKGAFTVAKDEFEKNYEKKELSVVITVKEAINPYQEAQLASGLPAAQSPEKHKTELNLAEALDGDRDSYQSAGLIEWAQSLNGLESKLENLSPEKKKIIKQEIKDGAIPVFMPGRNVQFGLTVERLTQQLKPLWIKDGQEQTVADTFLDWDHFKNIIQNKATELLADVSAGSYILFTKPSQKPEARTCNKNVSEQLQELNLINQERKRQKRAPIYSMNPHEYVALQKCFTEHAISIIPFKGTLYPLDKDTFTRFIHLPLAGGDVPGGCWFSGDRRLLLVGVVAGNSYAGSGFRLSVRVEI